MSDSRYTKVWLMVLCFGAFFVHNGLLPSDIMEARLLISAREMAYDGNWLIPTMNGNLRLEKPPMPTWAAGVVEMMCPDSLGAQRTVAGLMGCLWAWCLFLMARYVSRRRDVAVATVLVFITMYQVILMGRSATWDIWCHALMTAAAYCLLRAWCDRERQRPWLWLPAAGVLLGLSFMSKGPVAFFATLLPWLVAVVAVLRPRWQGRWGAVAVMLLLAAVVGGWWFAYIHLMHPEALQAVAEQETGAWGGRHIRPWYYYWRIVYETGIWAPATVAILFVPYWRRRIREPQTYLFAMVWMLATLVLLSVVPEKKPRYLLPVMAPCAMAVAAWLAHLKATKVVWGIAVLFLVIECTLMPFIDSLFRAPYGPSIAVVKTDKRLHEVPFYHPKDEPVRIELVNKAARKILPLDLTDSTAVAHHLPFALVVSKSQPQTLPASLLQQADTLSIGHFNDNTHKKGNRHYSSGYLTHVYLITPKQ